MWARPRRWSKMWVAPSSPSTSPSGARGTRIAIADLPDNEVAATAALAVSGRRRSGHEDARWCSSRAERRCDAAAKKQTSPIRPPGQLVRGKGLHDRRGIEAGETAQPTACRAVLRRSVPQSSASGSAGRSPSGLLAAISVLASACARSRYARSLEDAVARRWATIAGDGRPVCRSTPAPDHCTQAANSSGLSSLSPATTSGTPLASACCTSAVAAVGHHGGVRVGEEAAGGG